MFLISKKVEYNRNMIVLSGASASGKTEVAKVLAKDYGIVKIITTTTRAKRLNEIDGRDYFFVSCDRFKEMIKEGCFVEYTEYNKNFYGSTKDQIKENRCVVIDPSGLKAYSSLNDPNIVTFFLECSEDVRYERMLLRGDSVDEANIRITNDKETFKKEHIMISDFPIDSEHFSIEEVAREVVRLYQLEIKKRQFKK